MRIGIDCGSLTVKGALIDDKGRVAAREHRVHEGDVLAGVRRILFALVDGHDRSRIEVGLTGRHAMALAARIGVEPADAVACEIEGVRKLFGRVDHILHLGGGSLMLVSLDHEGNLLDFSSNSACAAGTGSFLDEQAARMGLSHEEANAIEPVDRPPSVATRCAVFAKTDLIHRQQEGFSRDELWCGLCNGMSRTAVQTLLKGREIEGRVAVTGGVAANPGMVHYLRKTLGADRPDRNLELLVSPDAAVCGAIGAAFEAASVPLARIADRLLASQTGDGGEGTSEAGPVRRPPLRMNRTRYPDFSVRHAYVDDEGTEVRVHRDLDRGARLTVLLGIDVGSTSTKGTLCDPLGRVVADAYRRTAGDPVGAGRKLLGALREIERRFGVTFDIRAVGTTGSGRKIVGAICGADKVVNEISAHVRGARSVDPSVSTIFEIGGQDSKYMRIQDGRIADANMNYVCAAGTGTFVEELGRKLGFSLEEIGEQALGAEPPHTSDRCTVFMEQDAFELARNGTSRREVMAAILYSVIENYRSKVVGNRPVGHAKVMFQGATARNMGLVAAIENVFDVEVVVSPYCHVMGAIGAALLAADDLKAAKSSTSFRGLGIADRDIKVDTDLCTLCSNHCVITTAAIEGSDERPSFGYLCGREPEDGRMRRNEEFAPFRARRASLGVSGARSTRRTGEKPRIGIPLALASWGYAPLFRSLIEELGAVPVFSNETDREIARLGAATVGSDFCFPVKVAHGHVAAMIDRDDLDGVFVPAMIEETRHPHASRSRFCPYLVALPSIVKHLFDAVPLGPSMVAPSIDFNHSPLDVGRSIRIALAGVLDVTEEQAADAWVRALAFQREYTDANEARGRELLEKLHAEGKKGVVIIGRPYNTLDPVVSVNLPLKVSESGVTVIPMDWLPFQPERLGAGLANMYWNYGQRILSAVRFVAEHPDLHAIYLTSFNCGPDSFVLGMAEHLMGEKPFLVLELDEHGSDGGYATRIEAFLDVVRGTVHGHHGAKEISPSGCTAAELAKRILWIPPMHPVAARLFAAVFRGHGFDARSLPDSDAEAHSLGRSAIRGSECTPMALTLGTFLKAVRDSGLPADRHAFFMPNATGPCRFGTYAQVQHMALERLGMGTVPILSPSSENSYLGMPMMARVEAWDAILLGDFLLKFVHATRPYEAVPGTCDRLFETWMPRLEDAFEARKEALPLLVEIARQFKAVPRLDVRKPLVGIVGEIYVRCDPFANANVVREIEAAGGEAWLAPFTEWILYTIWVGRMHARSRGDKFTERVINEFSNLYMERREHAYLEAMRPYIEDRFEPPVADVATAGMPYIPHEFEGESILTVGRAVRFFEGGADLVVNVAPFGCMHGHISGAVFERLSRKYERPIVTTFIDAMGSSTASLRSFVRAAARRGAAERPAVAEAKALNPA